jgi:plasmid stability protein
MATLLVRKLDEAVVERLKARAKARGRSVEAEHRAILEAALRPVAAPRSGKDLWTLLSSGPKVDLEIPELPHEEARPASFD